MRNRASLARVGLIIAIITSSTALSLTLSPPTVPDTFVLLTSPVTSFTLSNPCKSLRTAFDIPPETNPDLAFSFQGPTLTPILPTSSPPLAEYPSHIRVRKGIDLPFLDPTQYQDADLQSNAQGGVTMLGRVTKIHLPFDELTAANGIVDVNYQVVVDIYDPLYPCNLGGVKKEEGKRPRKWSEEDERVAAEVRKLTARLEKENVVVARGFGEKFRMHFGQDEVRQFEITTSNAAQDASKHDAALQAAEEGALNDAQGKRGGLCIS